MADTASGTEREPLPRRPEAGSSDAAGPGMSGALADNIAVLTARRQRDEREAPRSERIAGAIAQFAGSMTFVFIHVAVFGLWIAANTAGIPLVPRFDPSLVVLAMTASVEAIFLSTFVLINQNRMMVTADRRADLDLHISLLAEHELTRMAAFLEAIGKRLDVAPPDREYEEIKQDVEPLKVLDAIDRAEA